MMSSTAQDQVAPVGAPAISSSTTPPSTSNSGQTFGELYAEVASGRSGVDASTNSPSNRLQSSEEQVRQASLEKKGHSPYKAGDTHEKICADGVESNPESTRVDTVPTEASEDSVRGDDNLGRQGDAVDDHDVDDVLYWLSEVDDQYADDGSVIDRDGLEDQESGLAAQPFPDTHRFDVERDHPARSDPLTKHLHSKLTESADSRSEGNQLITKHGIDKVATSASIPTDNLPDGIPAPSVEIMNDSAAHAVTGIIRPNPGEEWNDAEGTHRFDSYTESGLPEREELERASTESFAKVRGLVEQQAAPQQIEQMSARQGSADFRSALGSASADVKNDGGHPQIEQGFRILDRQMNSVTLQSDTNSLGKIQVQLQRGEQGVTISFQGEPASVEYLKSHSDNLRAILENSRDMGGFGDTTHREQREHYLFSFMSGGLQKDQQERVGSIDTYDIYSRMRGLSAGVHGAGGISGLVNVMV